MLRNHSVYHVHHIRSVSDNEEIEMHRAAAKVHVNNVAFSHYIECVFPKMLWFPMWLMLIYST